MPTPYIIWMLAATQSELCQVVLNETEGLSAYLLALHTSEPSEAFIWQLGIEPKISARDRGAALSALGTAYKASLRRCGVRSIRFTCAPTEQRSMIEHLVASVFELAPATVTPFESCTSNCVGELEYRVTIP